MFLQRFRSADALFDARHFVAAIVRLRPEKLVDTYLNALNTGFGSLVADVSIGDNLERLLLLRGNRGDLLGTLGKWQRERGIQFDFRRDARSCGLNTSDRKPSTTIAHDYALTVVRVRHSDPSREALDWCGGGDLQLVA